MPTYGVFLPAAVEAAAAAGSDSAAAVEQQEEEEEAAGCATDVGGGVTLGLSPSEQIKMPFASTVQPGGVRASPLQFS